MSVLAWLFGLGGLAVALPFLLHLVRQQPKNRTEFSSLMFLKPTPPRLTEKKKLQNIFLLLLRMLAIALIAFAFMRPLFRSSGSELLSQTVGREIVVLLDASASMQRDGLRTQAVELLKEFGAQCEESDRISLLAFSAQSNWLVPFEDSDNGKDFSAQLDSCVQELEKFEFGFGEFPIDVALGFAAEELLSRNENRSEPAKQQIVLLTDQQQTPTINDLSAIRWDESMKVSVLQTVGKRSNATVVNAKLVPEIANQVSVRVSNHGTSGVTEFRYRFFDSTASVVDSTRAADEDLAGFYVANNKTETLQLSAASSAVNAIRIENDAFSYDNTFFFTKPTPQHIHVVSLTSEVQKNPDGLSFYLPKCFAGVPQRRVTISSEFENTEARSTIVVVNRELNDFESRMISQHLEAGGNVLVCLNDSNVGSLSELAGVESYEVADRDIQNLSNEIRDEYQMLVDVELTHPMFQAFRQPGLTDFSDIKFWRSVACELKTSSRRLASFDDGRPAIWEWGQSGQNGKVIGMATDWRPEVSQLALSVKFPILINEFVSWSCPLAITAKSLLVGQPIALPEASGDVYVTTPQGDRLLMETGLELFRETAVPGIYQVQFDGQTVDHAVNISPQESFAACYEQEQLASLGVVLGVHDSKSVQAEVLKRKADLDIESRQKAWKWVLCFAVLVLVMETAFAARSPGTIAAAGS